MKPSDTRISDLRPRLADSAFSERSSTSSVIRLRDTDWK